MNVSYELVCVDFRHEVFTFFQYQQQHCLKHLSQKTTHEAKKFYLLFPENTTYSSCEFFSALFIFKRT